MNKAILYGNAGKDPEVKHFEGGNVVAKFSLATNKSYIKNGEKVKETFWHNIVLWGKLAELAEKYVKKGSQIYIEGKLRTRSWDDKDKNKRFTTEIVADVMQLLGKKADDQGGGATPQQTPSSDQNNLEKTPPEEQDITNDLPF